MMKSSIILGSLIGAGVGALTMGGLGAITKSLNGILIGLVIGIVLGVDDRCSDRRVDRQNGWYDGRNWRWIFTGMLFGGVFGMLLGALIPASLRMRAHTEGLPVLDALMMGRFETAMLARFPAFHFGYDCRCMDRWKKSCSEKFEERNRR